MKKTDKSDVPWLEFLKLWLDLGIADLPGAFDTMDGYPEGAKKNTWGGYDVEVTAGKAFTIINGEDLFIAVENAFYDADRLPHHFLRYSTAKTPGAPPGFKVKNVCKIKTHYDRADRGIHCCGRIVRRAAITVPRRARGNRQDTLRLAGGDCLDLAGRPERRQPREQLPAGRPAPAIGLKTTDASAGRQALRNLDPSVRTQLYEAVISQGCAAPFAGDRSPVLHLIEKAWQAKMPKRLQIEAALQTRLSVLGKRSNWQRLNHEAVLAAAADPANHPLLQPRELEIRVDPNKTYGGLELAGKKKSDEADLGASLRSIVQLVALVHAETAAGHPCRAEMPALIKQTTMALNSPITLLALHSVHLCGDVRKVPLKPSEWLSKHVGKTKPNAKDGTARFDDGFITAAATRQPVSRSDCISTGKAQGPGRHGSPSRYSRH